MGDCTKITKRIAGNVGVMEEEQEAEASNSSLLLKKTKHNASDEEVRVLKVPLLLENDHSFVVSSLKMSSPSSDSFSVSDDFSTHSCSNNDIFKSADLKLKATSFETEVSECNNKFRFSSKEETIPLIDIFGDTEDQISMDSRSKTPPESHRRKPSEEDDPERMPSAAEIDEFFTEAEKQEQKRFAEKYNYDIVKDAPLEGRYQWVRLNESFN